MNTRRSTIVVLLLLVASVFTQGVAEQRYRGSGLAGVGQKAPDFNLPLFDKGSFKLSEANAKHPVVLWFTNMCKGCQSKIADFKHLRDTYKKKGVAFVAISMLGDDRKTAESIMKQHKVDYPVLYDPTGSATKQWSGKYIPGTCPLQNIFVIRPGGMITLADHLPGVEISDLEKEIANALR